ncbi:DNRLRE domain-containing protein [Sorangium cellulosum]|uniref:DNRLRE domain-containing protein n=1 Tax=Sorangium cellulosum TaxID=56 RepID=UPI001F1D7411|nr:DNRLRE domain-containing protein [Sorangium cellulosum]
MSVIAIGAACSPGAPDEGLHGTAKLAAGAGHATCVTIQRGTLGTVEDGTIWETFPTWSDSTVLLRTGTLAGFGVRHAVLRFDLSPVPAAATVVSATLRLQQIYRDDTSTSTINIHRITSPWTEPTVTWASLGNGSAFGPAIAASFQSLPGAGIRSADLTSLTAAWLAGTVPNQGVLLEEAPVLTTSFRSSEEPQIDRRPRLEVCYTTSASCTGTLDDNDACTTDTCDPVLGIQHTPISTDDGDPSTIDTCDPATGAVTHVACPALDPTVATRLIDAVACIYQGPNAPQTGVTATFDPASVAVIKGKVATRAGAPIPGVKVGVLHHGAGDAESYGQVLTRADGAFELVVRGGQPLTVKYEKSGYLPVQRQVRADWQHWSSAPDVVLIESDPVVTPVALGSTPDIQVARGSVQSDESGTRQATLLFPPGTTGTMTVPNPSGPPGSTTTVALPAEVHVRATEYTVGPKGPEAMPGALPPTSAYTYAVELGLDEAVAAGATKVEFNHPIPFYVENFLDFPVGMAVPLGYYDAPKAAWVPSNDGRIIEILDVSGGVASVDIDGDELADDASELAALGMSADELEQLATLYTAGTSLWRVQVSHFTPWDCNWPFGPPGDGASPPGPGDGGDGGGGGGGGGDGGGRPDPEETEDESCKEDGSIIECENQILGEALPIVGTPFSLHYQSDRAWGRKDQRRLRIPLTRSYVPASLKRIESNVTIAGRTFADSVECPCEPDQSYDFDWDGTDARGRSLVGKQPVSVEIGYVYDGVYRQPQIAGTTNGQSFGLPSSVAITGSRTRQEVTLWRRWERMLGASRNASDGLGGWSLSEHHMFDPSASTLYLGNGARVTGRTMETMLDKVAGRVPRSTASRADGVNATSAYVDAYGVAAGPDGSIYFSDIHTDRVRKISPGGIVSTVAGVDGSPGYNGDNRLATTAQLSDPKKLAFGPDGSLYIHDSGNRRIRRVDPSGTIVTAAGNGVYSNTTAVVGGVPATSTPLGENVGPITVGQDGSLYITCFPGLAPTSSSYVRRVRPDGIITVFAGTGVYPTGVSNGDGGPATEAQFTYIAGIAVAPDGTVYLSDAHKDRIRRVDTRGIITTIAGGGATTQTGDGGPASSAAVRNPSAMALGKDGSLYVYASGAGDYLIRRIDPNGIITTVAGRRGAYPGGCVDAPCGFGGPAAAAWLDNLQSLAVTPAGDLLLGYTHYSPIAGQGSISRVKAALPGLSANDIAVASHDGSEIYGFDEQGRHLVTRDALLGIVRYQFAYDTAGRLATITDVDNRVTTIQRDANGAPTAVVSPSGQSTALAVDEEGYLATVTNPANEVTTLDYYPGTGLLQSLVDPQERLHGFQYDAEGRLTRDTDPAGGFKALSRTSTASGYRVTLTTAEGRARVYEIDRLSTGAEERAHSGAEGHSAVEEISTSGARKVTTLDGTVISTELKGDPRFGMQSPIIGKETTTTPLGKTKEIIRSRMATLSDPLDLHSLVSLTNTVTINGNTFTEVFNRASRTSVSTTAAGRQVTTTLNAQGRMASMAAPGILPKEFTYHPDGRLHTLVQGSRTWTYMYDASGWPATEVDPLLHTTSFQYDPAGRIAQLTRADSEVTGTSYYDSGALQSVTPPDRPAHTFSYSEIDLQEGYQAPAAGGIPTETTWSHDLDGLLTSSSRPGEPATVYTRDPSSGRLSQVTLPLGMGTIGYGYHPTTGRVESITGPAGVSLAFVYDGLLLTRQTWTGTGFGSGFGRVQWTHDNDFRIDTETVTGGATINYDYDLDGYVSQVAGLTVSRHPANGLYTGSTVGIVSDTVTPDAYGAMATYVAQSGGSTIYEVTYTPDELGRVQSMTETIQGDTHTYEYAYDLAGLLYQVFRDGALAAHYDYDANGNRLGRTASSVVETGTYDDQDRLLTYGSKTYGISAAGDRTSVTDAVTGGTTAFTYDALGNLREVTLPNADVVRYEVDGQNRRIWERRNGALVRGFLYRDELRVVAELNASGGVVSQFVYAQDRNVPDLIVKGANTYRVLTDHRGSPRLVVHATTGAVAQRLDYDEFGRVLLDTNPGFQPFGFAGGLYDRNTGLVRFGARDYDPETGRWTAKDPTLLADGTNVYAYASGDPINYFDPDGRAAHIIPALGPLVLPPAVLATGIAVGAAIVVGFGAKSAVCMIKLQECIDESPQECEDYRKPPENRSEVCGECFEKCMENARKIWYFKNPWPSGCGGV